ncbi:hypothetical protein PAPYR_5010 [Paratrimastix pyriformis]|uniref:Uncharacterized protein n=1 Tax=Paratrimastix pyriformis TaxID=342808 RepID=A0ABQ8UL93_9EUKA|nr:hypothetical protein PAPYR_5010 [Paratrimastix pyriformis]
MKCVPLQRRYKSFQGFRREILSGKRLSSRQTPSAKQRAFQKVGWRVVSCHNRQTPGHDLSERRSTRAKISTISQKSCSVLNLWGDTYSSPALLPASPGPTRSAEMFENLPPDLLLAIVEASAWRLRTYIEFLSLNHSIRTAVRGAPHELSFISPDPVFFDLPAPPQALAALVGPCRGLRKLSLPNRTHPLFYCGPSEVECAWVGEAFTGHEELAVLHIPTADPFNSALPRILRYLPGLRVLHFATDSYSPREFLGILGRWCPDLEEVHISGFPQPINFEIFRPLAGSLKRLEVSNMPAIMGLQILKSFTHLEAVAIPGVIAALRPCAPRLTRLALDRGPVEDLAGMGLCRLETFELKSPAPAEALIHLLATNSATLRTVSVMVRDPTQIKPILATLDTLPHLASLELSLPVDKRLTEFPACSTTARLEQLTVSGGIFTRPIRIDSPRLRTLHLGQLQVQGITLVLTCPALEDLHGPSTPWDCSAEVPLDLKCPRLRRLALAEGTHLQTWCPMPDLVQVQCAQDPVWLPQLLTESPRLGDLQTVCIRRPQTLACLAEAAIGLTRLALSLNALVLADRLVRMPPRLESLQLLLTGPLSAPGLSSPADLEIEIDGPGIRSLCLDSKAGVPVRLSLRCPALVDLVIDEFPGLSSFDFLSPAVPLRSLRMGWTCRTLEAASLLQCLTRHGAHLRRLSLACTSHSCRSAWPQIAAALGRLPCLTLLTLGDHPTAEMALACPALRWLALQTSPETEDIIPLWEAASKTTLRSLVLNCPALEELRAPVGSCLKTFELNVPAPSLRRIVGVSAPWMSRLMALYPGRRFTPCGVPAVVEEVD